MLRGILYMIKFSLEYIHMRTIDRLFITMYKKNAIYITSWFAVAHFDLYKFLTLISISSSMG